MKITTAKTESENPLGYERISTLIRRFAIPSIVAMLVSSLYNIVDQIFIGHGVGYLGNAATNVSFPLTSICLALALLTGVGGAAKYAIELGKHDRQEAALCVGGALWMTAVLGLGYCVLIELFLPQLLTVFGATPSVLPYSIQYVRITALGMPLLFFTNVMSNFIRADGTPRFSMACNIVGAVLNTILDPIFIFALDMGVRGAAIATVIAQSVSFILAASYLFRMRQVTLTRAVLVPRVRKCVEIASYGLSSSLNQVAICLLQITMNNSLTYYGAMSIYGEDIPLSAAGVVMKVNALFNCAFVGLHQGCQPIIGYNYGAKQYDRAKEVYRQAVIWSLFVSIPGFILFECFPEAVIRLFGSDEPLYLAFAVKYMRGFLFMIVLNGIQLLSANFFSAIGKPKKGVVLSLSRQFFFLIPLILILPRFFGVEGLIFSGPVSDVIAFLLGIAFIRKEFRRMGQPAAKPGQDGTAPARSEDRRYNER